MRLGMLLRYHGDGLALDEVLEAERLGYDSVWSGEAYGTDAVTPTAWILARTTRIRAGTGIMQMQARTPACTAMTALTVNDDFVRPDARPRPIRPRVDAEPERVDNHRALAKPESAGPESAPSTIHPAPNEPARHRDREQHAEAGEIHRVRHLGDRPANHAGGASMTISYVASKISGESTVRLPAASLTIQSPAFATMRPRDPPWKLT